MNDLLTLGRPSIDNNTPRPDGEEQEPTGSQPSGEGEKENLLSLLNEGFITETEYNARLAKLNGEPVPEVPDP